MRKLALFFLLFLISPALAADETFDLVLGSPPYFPLETGVHGDHPQKVACRFEVRGDIMDYARVASEHLAAGGVFACVFPEEQRRRVETAAETVQMTVVRRRPVMFKAGETPLHGAAFRGVNPVVEHLVAHGARLDARDGRGWTPLTIANGISHGDVFKQQPQTAALLKTLMTSRGLSTEGQSSDGTECLDCIQTHADQARAALERDVRMEKEFAESDARSRR